jgi:hypothetical protein
MLAVIRVGLLTAVAVLVAAAPAAAKPSASAPTTIRWAKLHRPGLPVTVKASSRRRRTADLRVYAGTHRLRRKVFTFRHQRTYNWRMHLRPATYGLSVRVRHRVVLRQPLLVPARPSVPPPVPPQPPPQTVTVAAVGDLCSGSSCSEAAATAATIQAMHPDRYLVLGDLQYPQGDQATFDAGYARVFAALHAISLPVFGSTHDFGWRGYPVAYMNTHAGPEARGKLSDGQPGYSYNLGAWHLVALNYNGGQNAVDWLRADLAAHPSKCLAAVVHAPIYGSPTGEHPDNQGAMFAAVLQAAGVDIVASGHQHFYERLTTPTGTQIINGEGGIGHYHRTSTAPGSRVYDDTSYGVVKLTLSPDGWASEYVPNRGSTFSDTASGGC